MDRINHSVRRSELKRFDKHVGLFVVRREHDRAIPFITHFIFKFTARSLIFCDGSVSVIKMSNIAIQIGLAVEGKLG